MEEQTEQNDNQSLSNKPVLNGSNKLSFIKISEINELVKLSKVCNDLKSLKKFTINVPMSPNLIVDNIPIEHISTSKEASTKIESKQKQVKQQNSNLELTYDNIFKDRKTKKMIEKCLIDLRYINHNKIWNLGSSTKELGLFIDVMIGNDLHNDYFKKKSISSMMSQKYMGIEVVKYHKLKHIDKKEDILDSIKQAIKTNNHKI